MGKPLDFVIIGAQKSGTTSLHKYLEALPGVSMPAVKEAVFFSHDERWAAGWERFADEFFAGSDPRALWGKATPHYMADPLAPARIRTALPDARVVALLRHPVDRAVSHYRMAVRRGVERRTVDQAMEALLAPDALARARVLRPDWDAEVHCYLAWGEYERILGAYDSYFRAGRGLVLFTETLADDPAGEFTRLAEFLGLPAEARPANLGERYHQGGTRRRFPMAESLFRHPLTRRIGRLFPRAARRRVIYWMNYSNVAPERPETEVRLSPEMRARLVEHFRGDVRALEARAGRPVPWPEFRAPARG